MEETPAISAERPSALQRFEREERIRTREADNMTPLQLIQQSRRSENERIRAAQLAECLRFQNAVSFEELDRRYANYEQLRSESEDAWTFEEVERAHQRHEERRTQYLLELGIPDRKKTTQTKPRKYLEDDDDVPELQSEDDDSDDEDTPSRYQTSDWRNAHKAAAHSTLSSPSITSTDNNSTPTSTTSTRSKQIMNTTKINPPSPQRNTPAIRLSVNTVENSESRTDIAPSAQTLQNLWHQRLGHPKNRRLREMAMNPIYTARGFPALSARQLDMKAVCDACMIENHTRSPLIKI
jgi:hypothetical protein